jgi:hypothetical protein
MRGYECVEGFLTEVNMEIGRRDDIQVHVVHVHSTPPPPPPPTTFSSAFHLRLIAV